MEPSGSQEYLIPADRLSHPLPDEYDDPVGAYR